MQNLDVSSHSSHRTAPPHPDRPSILVIDDDPDVLEVLTDFLEAEGFHADVASSCRQAFASIEQGHYAAALLDLGLPDGDGQSVLQKIQESDPSLPVIVLTAHTSTERKVRSLTRGAFAYITKPYHQEELRAIIQQAVGLNTLATKAEGFELALAESEERFRSIVQSAPDAIVVADDHGYIVTWNVAASKMFQYTPGEVLGKPLAMLMPMRFREAHEMGIERMRTTGRSSLMGHVITMQGLRKDGREFPIELSLAAWKGRGRSFYCGIIRDISSRTGTEAALREHVERLRLLVDHLPMVFWITDTANNELLYVSPSYEQIWGRPCEELRRSARAWLDAVHPNDRPRVLHAALTKQALGTYAEEYRLVRPDGTVRWIRDQAFPVRDSSGVVSKIVGLAEDITRQKKLEEAAQLAEQRMQHALATAELGIWEWDCQANRLYCSGRAMELLGQQGKSQTVSLDTFVHYVYEADRDLVQRAFSSAEESGTIACQHRVSRTDGSLHRLAWFGCPLRDKDGAITRVVGSVGIVEERR